MIGKGKFIIAVIAIIIFRAVNLFCSEDMLSPDQMRENLSYIKKKILEIHPNPYHKISKYEYQHLYKNLVAECDHPMPQRDFYFIAMKFIMGLEDGHTDLGYYDPAPQLPIIPAWRVDGFGILLANEKYKELSGARVLAIEGISMDQWLKNLSEITPHENMDWVRVQGEAKIQDRNVIAHFTGKPDIATATLTVEKDGRVFDFDLPFLPFEEHPGFQKPDPDAPVQPRKQLIVEDRDDIPAAFIEILSTGTTDELFASLDDFMEDAKKRKVSNIVFDIRRNPGGNTDFVEELLKHLPIDEAKMFSGYGKVTGILEKYSPDQMGIQNKPDFWKRQPSQKDIEPYRGRIYILISNNTFSSAVYFPAVFKDNNLATLVGERTGNAPCAYGSVDSDPNDLPHGNFRLFVSQGYLIRPSGICDNNALNPDVEVPRTLDDWLARRNPVMDWLKKNLK